jgi:hypothetical protein
LEETALSGTSQRGKWSPRDAGHYRGFDVRWVANWTDVKYESTNGGVNVYA